MAHNYDSAPLVYNFFLHFCKPINGALCQSPVVFIPEAKSKSAGANVTAKNEPWVLASQVDQCFFITDPPKPSRVVVRRGKRKIIGMDGVANEQDFDKYGDPKMEHDDDDEVSAYTTRRSRTTLPKGRPFKRRTPFTKNKGKKIVNR